MMESPFSVISETSDFLVLNKASGISSHPAPGDPSPDLVTLCARNGKKVAPVTRLDNQASGLALLSGSAEFISAVKEIRKTYLALVVGVPPDSGTIDARLTSKKFGSGEKRQQEAVTHFKLLSKFQDVAALLSLTLETGRHHQIRKHLRSIGHPIIGDFRHGYKDRNISLQNGFGKRIRLFLHCHSMDFVWQEETFHFASEIPEDMAAFIKHLESSLCRG
jgi:23S rRNA-/tRNA-specific pseudouridylate synthase